MVDAIVTLGTIIGFTLALALMVAEWLLAPAAALTQTIAAKVTPAATPTVVAGSTNEPCAAPKPL